MEVIAGRENEKEGEREEERKRSRSIPPHGQRDAAVFGYFTSEPDETSARNKRP